MDVCRPLYSQFEHLLHRRNKMKTKHKELVKKTISISIRVYKWSQVVVVVFVSTVGIGVVSIEAKETVKEFSLDPAGGE